MPQQDDVKQIRTLIDDWAAGLRAKDAKRVKRHGAKDLVHFSLAPPLVADESGPYGLEKWFKTWDGPLGYELRDLEIVSGDGVAFSHSLNHLTGTATRREAGPLVPQHTLFPQGRWRVEDRARAESVPFLMDGSDKAALDLNP